MSKLVEGIKDRMVAAAREAAPAVVDAAQKAATAAAEKVLPGRGRESCRGGCRGQERGRGDVRR